MFTIPKKPENQKRIQKAIKVATIFALLASTLHAQYVQNPSSGVYGITENSASDSQVFLKNTTSSGISRWVSEGGNGAINAQVIADPTTGLARFGTTISGADVDMFSPRNLFLSTDPGTGVTPRLTVKQNGYVGINTITPQKSVEIQTLSNDAISVGRPLLVGEWTGIHIGYLEPWNSYYRKAGIGFYRTDSSYSRGKLILFNNSNADASSGTIGDARLTVDEAGKVGIGTTTPQSQLDVFGTTVIRNYSGSDGLKVLRGGDTNSPAFQVTIDSTTPYVNSWGPLVFQTGATGSNPGERLRIGTNGNIGINNSNPSQTLDVNGTFGVSGQTTLGPTTIAGMNWVQSGDFRVGDSVASPSIRLAGPNNWDFYLGVSIDKIYLRRNSIPKFAFTSDGKLGVGTTVPTARLEISDSSNNETALHINAAGVGANVPLIRFQQNNQTKWGLFAEYPTSGLFSVFSNGLNDVVMAFKDNGNVGIGTTTPSAKLEVKGSLMATSVSYTVLGWADKVFEEGYSLRSIDDVEKFISIYKHLPDVPSEKEIVGTQKDVNQLQALLLQKIEELNLYVIQLNKENKNLKNRVEKLESK